MYRETDISSRDETMAAAHGVQIAEGQTNRTEGSIVEAKVPPAPLFFLRPATGELVVVMPQDRPAFLHEVQSVDDFIGRMMRARSESQTLQDELMRLPHTTEGDAQSEPVMRQLDKVLAEEASARKAAHEALDGVTLNPGADLIELLPLSTRTNPQGLPLGKKFTYVRSTKVENHWRAYKLSGADKPQLKSFLTYDKKNGWKLDEKKLSTSLRDTGQDVLKKLKKLETPKIEKQLAEVEAEWSPEFVQAFNGRAHFVSPDEENDMVQYGGGARVLRAFAGASVALEGNFKGSLDEMLEGKLPTVKAALKGKAEGALILAEGQVDLKLLLPHARGLKLLGLPALRHDKTGDTAVDYYPMGFVRLAFEFGANGSVGASVLAEGGVELEFDPGGVQQLKGRGMKRKASDVRARSLVVNDKKNAKAKAGADLETELSAFAGASAEGSVKGAMQWQQPESKAFGDFAMIEPKIAGLAGIGGSAAFSIGYSAKDKKFRIVAKLAGCVGLGLSGKIGAEIGVGEIWEFACWFRHQVVAARDQNLAYFMKDAYEAFSAMYTLAILEGKKLASYLGKEVDDLKNQLLRWVRANQEEFAKAVKESTEILLMASANVKGFLLEQLRLLDRKLDAFKDEADETWRQMKDNVKEALDWLLGAVYQQAELENVYQYATVDFSKRADTREVEAFVANTVGSIQMASLNARLKDVPAIGYRLARNDEFSYQLQYGVHTAWNDKGWGNGSTALA